MKHDQNDQTTFPNHALGPVVALVVGRGIDLEPWFLLLCLRPFFAEIHMHKKAPRCWVHTRILTTANRRLRGFQTLASSACEHRWKTWPMVHVSRTFCTGQMCIPARFQATWRRIENPSLHCVRTSLALGASLSCKINGPRSSHEDLRLL